MSLAAWFKQLFGYPGDPPHDYVESAALFLELDLQRMRKRFRLVEEGTTRGKENEPPTSQENFDDVESSVVTTIQAEENLAHAKLIEHLRAYDARLGTLSIGTHLVQLTSTADATSANFRNSIRNG